MSSLKDPVPDLEYTLGSSRRIRLRDAEKELRDLWEVASREAERKGQEGVLRLRELNLIVYAQGDAVAERVSQVIARLAQRHPARAIILLEVGKDAPGDGATDAWVSAACYLTPQGERHVCWEQVTIPAWGRAADLLDTTAMPVLVPHLPAVLWWPGQPDFSGDIFRRLSDVSALVVVDSAGFSNPVTGLCELSDVVQLGSRNYNVNDLNWGRLTAWREMLADLFDEPQRLELLEKVVSVKIAYGAEDTYERTDRTRAPAAARAALLAGWLGSRLGWEVAEAGWQVDGANVGVTLRDPARPGFEVRVDLESRELPDSVPGGLISVELRMDGGGGGDSGGDGGGDGSEGDEPTVSIRRVDGSCMCESRLKQPGVEVATRTVDVDPVPEDRLLAEELDQLGPDRVFEESLQLTAALLRLPGGDHLHSSVGLDT